MIYCQSFWEKKPEKMLISPLFQSLQTITEKVRKKKKFSQCLIKWDLFGILANTLECLNVEKSQLKCLTRGPVVVNTLPPR